SPGGGNNHLPFFAFWLGSALFRWCCWREVSRFGIAFGIITSTIVRRIRPFDLRVSNNTIASDPTEIFDAVPATVLVLFQEFGHALYQSFDHVRSNGMIQHCSRANLDRTASK